MDRSPASSSVAEGLVDRYGPYVEAAGTWRRSGGFGSIGFLLGKIRLSRDGWLITDEFDVRR